MRQRELHLPSKRSQLEIRMLRLPSLQHLRLVPGPHWPQPTHLPLQQLWEKVGDVTETPKVLRVEHTIFVFVNDSSGQFAVTTSEPKSCFHTKINFIKFNNDLKNTMEMGEEWEQTLRAMGWTPSFSNPVQRYGESMIRASILAKNCNFENWTNLTKNKMNFIFLSFCRFSFPRR